ncbi:MAG: transcription antitermination factor NusB [Planctomycetota bacterium]|jgi:16S rRNA (cytosine967-C5)-methyltransferase
MAGKKTKPARVVAAEVLNKFDPKRNYAGPILDKLLRETDQRQRATDLVFGSIRNRCAIDAVIAVFSGCPLERIPAELLNIIRIGAYELIYSPATEEYSIVSEAVENVKAVAGTKQVGFVNALLRQITRHLTNRQIPLSQAQSKRTLPQTSATGCEFDTCFLPDHETCPADYLSTVFSLPKWLVSNWLDEFGEELARQICFASNRRPSVYLRPNRLKTTAEKLAEKLRQADIDFQIADDREPRMLKIKSPRAVTQLPGFASRSLIGQYSTSAQHLE